VSAYVIPFLVVDRPASLRIIKGSGLHRYDVLVGLMGHANTSTNFQKLFRIYPCSEPGTYCDVVGKKCPHEQRIESCPDGLRIRQRTVKMCDCGIFTKEGCKPEDYNTLFEIYDGMGAQYGVMIDCLRDSERTIESAKEGIKAYRTKHRQFRLVGVTQGEDQDEYLSCYEKLKSLGYEFIAVGGLLKKIENSARYVSVRDEKLLDEVLNAIRNRYPTDWLYALGCYHPNRHDKFRRLHLFGGDYKGWIFNYIKLEDADIRKAQKHRFAQVRGFLRKVVYSQLVEDKKLRRLLILPCSKAKARTAELLPAIERYQGPFFRLVNRVAYPNSLDVMILSAKYGLIPANTRIEYYDLKMDDSRALELQARVLQELIRQLDCYCYDEIFINLGRQYMKALNGVHDYIPETTKLIIAEGRIGQRLKQMKEWLTSINILDHVGICSPPFREES
jgi:hypothetical protein